MNEVSQPQVTPTHSDTERSAARPLKVFQSTRFGSLELRNRVAMAPMTRRMAAEDGIPTAAMAEYYRRRAAGEVGLIISEGTAIDDRHAYDTLTVPRFQTAEQFAGWRRIVEAVHGEGGAFAPQLWHTGRMGYHPIGPSEADMPARKDGTPRPRVKAMTDEDFAQVLDAYARAASAAKSIGCDALEIHGAHGYLLDSFLSPAMNRRSDRYGGSFESRMRFPLEVVRAVRAAVGPGFPIIYRFSQWRVDDYAELKFKSPDELGVWVKALTEAGVDLVHVSTRRALDPGFQRAPDGTSYGARTLAGWTRELSGLPTIAVGAISLTLTMDRAYGDAHDAVADPSPCFRLIEDGEADLIAVGRALIANPDWVKIARDGDWRDLRPFDKSMLEALE